MCGIAGFLDFDRQRCADPLRLLDSMRDTLTHRGPDAGGSALEAEGRIGLGHRRKWIQGVSEPVHCRGGVLVQGGSGPCSTEEERDLD